jgi:hypothetical protein
MGGGGGGNSEIKRPLSASSATPDDLGHGNPHGRPTQSLLKLLSIEYALIYAHQRGWRARFEQIKRPPGFPLAAF